MNAAHAHGYGEGPGIVTRARQTDQGELGEVLVMADAYNLTGGYLIHSEVANDHGQPCLKFKFCDAGGQFLAKLTGEHLPDRATGVYSRLGVILDGELWSAATINSALSDDVVLTGGLRQQELSDLARILNTGPLPYRLRLLQVFPPGAGSDKVSGTFFPTGPNGDPQKRFLTPFLEERKRLVGTWIVVNVSPWNKLFRNVGTSADGKNESGEPMTREQALAAARLVPVVITEERYSLARYAIDPTKDPKTIDLFMEGEAVMMSGIYEFEGERLRIKFGSQPGQRPTTFAANADDDSGELIVLERASGAPKQGARDEKPLDRAKPMAVERTPKGPVLTYEIVPEDIQRGFTTADMEKVLKLVEKRLNPAAEDHALVRPADSGPRYWRIEIALMCQDEADKRRVERLLARPGTLEFRVLANKQHDKELIEPAEKDESKTEVLDSSGKRLAWWVPIKAGQERSLGGRDVVRRTRAKGDREITETLVVADPYNVTGDYLTKAVADTDARGRPEVALTFNEAGGQLFEKLTGDHLPDPAMNLRYRLGIILDGKLCSAPIINSRISDKGTITGVFTKEEVSDLVDILNAGSLPVRLRLLPGRP